MGLLECDDGERFRLWGDHLVGRGPDAALRLDDSSISWRHASLRWTGKVWELLDLASLNGTFLGGKRLEAGVRMPLRVGAELRFGECPRVFELVDDDPPLPTAVALDTGERVALQDGMIGLPDQSAPEVAIYCDVDGRWLAECSDRVWAPAQDEVIEAGGRSFRFERGAVVFSTSATRGHLMTPGQLALEFEVSRNEEHVGITVVHDSARVSLRPRAHGYMLLTLARLRIEDQLDPDLAVESHGWVEQGRLLKMLATTSAQLALDIYRARRQFGDAGVVDSAHIIERRPDSRELRLGVEHLTVRVA